jgi:uncharacterized protein (DUF983 family)
MSKPHTSAAGDGTTALVLGIVLTVVGAGVLIQRATGVEVWNHLWRLWPVLLIIMGVKVVVGHYGARRSGKENRP